MVLGVPFCEPFRLCASGEKFWRSRAAEPQPRLADPQPRDFVLALPIFRAPPSASLTWFVRRTATNAPFHRDRVEKRCADLATVPIFAEIHDFRSTRLSSWYLRCDGVG